MKLRILYKQKGQTPEGKREILEWFIANAPDGALKEFGLTRPKQGEQNPEQERRKQVILDRVERYFKPESDDRER